MNYDEFDNPAAVTLRGKLQLAAAAIYVLLNLAVPAFFEDLYPFTRGPMFCDQPEQYCNYYVYAPDGRTLPLDEFHLQRVYDGNPPGLGVGMKHPPTLDQFGKVPEESTLRSHVCARLLQMPELDYVEVVQEVIGRQGNTVGVVKRNRWRIARSRPER